MTYINLSKILPPNPNDPNVSVTTQINANWDEIERVLSAQQGLSAIVNPEVGLEIVDHANMRFTVYDGTSFITSDDIKSAWSAWTALPLLAPIVLRTGFTPRWRSNSLLRKVEIVGRVQNGSSPATFGTATYDITADTGGIPDTLKPATGKAIYNKAATIPISPGLVSASYVTVIPNPSAGQSVKVQGRFLGTSDGTSSIVLDGISWWY